MPTDQLDRISAKPRVLFSRRVAEERHAPLRERFFAFANLAAVLNQPHLDRSSVFGALRYRGSTGGSRCGTTGPRGRCRRGQGAGPSICPGCRTGPRSAHPTPARARSPAVRYCRPLLVVCVSQTPSSPRGRMRRHSARDHDQRCGSRSWRCPCPCRCPTPFPGSPRRRHQARTGRMPVRTSSAVSFVRSEVFDAILHVKVANKPVTIASASVPMATSASRAQFPRVHGRSNR